LLFLLLCFHFQAESAGDRLVGPLPRFGQVFPAESTDSKVSHFVDNAVFLTSGANWFLTLHYCILCDPDHDRDPDPDRDHDRNPDPDRDRDRNRDPDPDRDHDRGPDLDSNHDHDRDPGPDLDLDPDRDRDRKTAFIFTSR
jgi:hypothetical protein